MTLVFLGWQDESAAEAIARAAFDAAPGGGAVLTRGRLCKPLPPRDPRLFALDLEDPGGRASALQAAVSDALGGRRLVHAREAGLLAARDPRARKKGASGACRRCRVTWRRRRRPSRRRELTLYRSTLRPQGALYEPLARATL